MKKISNFLIFLFALGLIFSCNTNDDNSNTDEGFSQNFGSEVSRDFIGQVVNQNGDAIQNAEIKIGSKTVQTDANGVFIVNDADVHERFAYITAKKSGYIDGSRAMVPTTGKNNVKIMLISNTPIQTIQSDVTSDVTLPNGTKVTFDGAFQDENGNTYSGDVQVAIYHLESSSENISSLMPGMLYAEDNNGDEKVLETYGMMNVELKGSNGQKLQIATDHTAQITMAIDPAQLATAPSTIPLWHFNEEKGYWIEEGNATRVGNNYVGNVSHFSWWNCDYPYPLITLTVNVHDSNGQPLPNIAVSISNDSQYYCTQFTDSNGQVSGFVPASTILSLLVTSNDLTISLHESTLGPLTSNTTVNIVVEESSTLLINKIVGTLIDCESLNVTNGYVMMGRLFYPVRNGQFEFNTIRTSDTETFTLKGRDYITGYETGTIAYSYSETDITQVGNFSACTGITEFISYQIDNSPTVVMRNNLSFTIDMSNFLSVSGRNVALGKEISIVGVAGGTGSNAMLSFILQGTDFGVIRSGGTNTITYSAAPIGPVGSYADVTFNGTFTDTSGTHTLSGLIHAFRDQ